MYRSPLRSILVLSLAALSVVGTAACAGGGGGNGGGDDDDDDGTPTPPARPGWVVFRLQETLSIAEADGDPSLVDVTTAPAGAKTLVGFSSNDDVVYMVATSSGKGDLYAVGVDGTNDRLLATEVTSTFDWADGTHLLVQKGPGPAQMFPPSRDLYVVPVDGTGEVALATDAQDEEFGGLHGSTVVFRRGPNNAESALWAIPALGGTATQLTSETGPELFDAFSASGRVIYRNGPVGNSNVYSVPLAGGSPATLADGPNPELPAFVQGERVVIQEEVPTMDASEGNVKSVNADGTGAADLSATPDVPENALAISEGGQVLISLQTSFDPPAIDLVSVPAAGGTPVTLGSIADGGIAWPVPHGETVFLLADAGTTLKAIETDGSGERTLDTAGGEIQVWAVTASRVIYAVAGQAGQKLWSVPGAGGNAVQLRQDAGADTFAASLANIVVMSVPGQDNLGDVVAVDSDGGNLRVLAGEPEPEQFRAITPDGRVIFTRKTAFLDDLFIVGADGTGEIGLSDRADADVYLGFLP